MKTAFTLFFVLICSLRGLPQENSLTSYDNSSDRNKNQINFAVKSTFSRGVLKSTLRKSSTLSDFVDGYPSGWIRSYDAVGLWIISDGHKISSSSTSDTLTNEQKKLLASADVSSEIVLVVHDRFENPVTGKIENGKIDLRMRVLPETEAAYLGGNAELKKYLQRSIIERIPEAISMRIADASVVFDIDETGQAVNAKIIKSTGVETADQLMIRSLYAMPKWKAARNEKGEKIKQQFEFRMSRDGC